MNSGPGSASFQSGGEAWDLGFTFTGNVWAQDEGSSRFVESHIWRKERAPDMGHPGFVTRKEFSNGASFWVSLSRLTSRLGPRKGREADSNRPTCRKDWTSSHRRRAAQLH